MEGLVVFIAMVITHMLSVHLPLAMRNLTSIEDFYENMDNPFESGSAQANLAQVFGDFGADWFIPVSPLKPLSDGICFARMADQKLGLAHDGPPLSVVNDEELRELTWRWRYN